MIGALNGICPYFTMFPLQFPQRILRRYGKADQTVLDPFVGRGTTIYAGRLRGMNGYGIDSNPVAVAIARGKLANTTPDRVVAAARGILRNISSVPRPTGEFWDLAFDSTVLGKLCRLRVGLMEDCRSDARKALRALILGALHGPTGKTIQSYFSNQCPRTYSPKPGYAVRFWKARRLTPPKLDVIELIKRRAERFYPQGEKPGVGYVIVGDSQCEAAFKRFDLPVSWIITSPPYYGMRSYVPDQWLRTWFVGGPAKVTYSSKGQLSHWSTDDFRKGLSSVWRNCAAVSKPGCRMIIRFGAINDRDIDALALLKQSLSDTGWRITNCRNAGSASQGRRQADHFVTAEDAITEYDVWTMHD